MSIIARSVQQAWDKRDKSKSDEENVNRIANAFGLTDKQVREIVT